MRSGFLVLVVSGTLLGVYTATLLPGVGYSGDTAKFQFAGPVLGTVHPTGYPTYLMLSHVFGRWMPWGRLAWRVNLLSAVCAALAAGLCAALLVQLGVPAIPAAASALALGVTPVFWSQAVVAEVYALQALLVTVVWWLLARWRTGGSQRDLYAALFVLAFSLGNHMTTILAVPAVAIYVLRHEPKIWRNPRLLGWSVLCLAIGLGQYSYYVWRSHDPSTVFLETRVTGLADLWGCITAARYRGQMFAWPASIILRQRLPDLLGQGLRDLTILLPLALYGAVRLRLPGFRGLLLLHAGCTLAFAAGYAIPDIAVFLLPVHITVALLAGVGLGGLYTRIPATAQSRRLAALACLALPAFLGAHNLKMADRSGDVADAHRTEALLTTARDGAVFLTTDYREASFLRYYVLGEDLQAARRLYVQSYSDPEEIVGYLRGGSPLAIKGQHVMVPPGLVVVTTNRGVVDALRSYGAWGNELAGGLIQVAATRDDLRGAPPPGTPGLLPPHGTVVSWGEGWGPPETWGRWMFAREAGLQVRAARPGARLHFEAATWEALGMPQEVVVAHGDSVLCRVTIAADPWRWQLVDVPLPETSGPLQLVVRVANTTVDTPPGRRTRGLPVRNLAVE
jgi:hypothetical protein